MKSWVKSVGSASVVSTSVENLEKVSLERGREQITTYVVNLALHSSEQSLVSTVSASSGASGGSVVVSVVLVVLVTSDACTGNASSNSLATAEVGTGCASCVVVNTLGTSSIGSSTKSSLVTTESRVVTSAG
jgi:hypothetical protein